MSDLLTRKAQLFGSLLMFTRVFYKLRTGREFEVKDSIGRESHIITICRELTKAFRLETNRLLINVPPGHGKSTLLQHFVAWSMAQQPDGQFLYISYSSDLAAEHTYAIKQIMSLPDYEKTFGVTIAKDSSAKDNFKTMAGGAIKAFGSAGSITGQNGGLQGVMDRFTGAIIMDDMHKPDEVFSDTRREAVKTNYGNTILQRARSPIVPFIFLGQRLHEDDLPAGFIDKKIDGHEWKQVILKAIDDAGNVLAPHIKTKQDLRLMEEHQPYAYAAQYQQNPQPAGGGIFKPEWFVLLDKEPEILATFITADTAETDKNYNDATVFSFWGLYRILEDNVDIDLYGLHWIDCYELRIEPKDLEAEFRQFYADCMRHKVKPKMAAIEKKSTGTTLLSVLKGFRGLQLIDIERNRGSGSKIARFFEIQRYIASKRVSLPCLGKHTAQVIDHCRKITANGTHRFDDICFVKGTKIATLFGYKNIENIVLNDLIITPFGLGRVACCGISNKNSSVIKNINLIGTPNHPIFTKEGFIPLAQVNTDKNIFYFSFKELLKWKYRQLLLSMEMNIRLWDRNAIILASRKIIMKEKVLKDFMWQFGNFIVAKKLPKGMWFITKMVIISITTLIIWNVFRISNILRCMQKKGKVNQLLKMLANIWKTLGKWLQSGTEVPKGEGGIEKTVESRRQKYLKKYLHAFNAVKNFWQKEILLKPVAKNAGEDIEERECLSSRQIALFAIRNFPEKNKLRLTKTQKPVLENVQESYDLETVYNLTVDKYGVYFANDILVSNCDTLADAVRIALIDEVVSRETIHSQNNASVVKDMMNTINQQQAIRDQAYGRRY